MLFLLEMHKSLLVHNTSCTCLWKNGVKLDECLTTFKDLQRNKSSIDLNPEDYPGGVALWGCAISVYDTTSFKSEPGIHVHARKAFVFCLWT